MAAADIGEMLLEKNRSLTQKVVELQRELEEQVTMYKDPCKHMCW